jgi:hypothetical protein
MLICGFLFLSLFTATSISIMDIVHSV